MAPIATRNALKGYLTRLEDDVNKFLENPDLTNVEEIQELFKRVQGYKTQFEGIHVYQLQAQADRVIELVEHEGVMNRADKLLEYYQRFLIDRGVVVYLSPEEEASNGQGETPVVTSEHSLDMSRHPPVTQSTRIQDLEFPPNTLVFPTYTTAAPITTCAPFVPTVVTTSVHVSIPSTSAQNPYSPSVSVPISHTPPITTQPPYSLPTTTPISFNPTGHMQGQYRPSIFAHAYQTSHNPQFMPFGTSGAQLNPNSTPLEQAMTLLLSHQAQAENRTLDMLTRLNDSMNNRSQRAESHPKLPTLTVPQFSGDSSAWPHFKDMFRSIIHNNPRLSDMERLQYLMASVTGSAKRMVENLPMSEENYPVAWNVLEEQFDDRYSIIDSLMAKFCKLAAVSTATVDNFTTLYTTALSIINSLLALEVTTPDLWIIHLLSIKLDDQSKIEWSKEVKSTVPTLDQFLKFMGERLRSIKRCQSSSTKPVQAQAKNTAKVDASVLATSANYSCPACQSMEHKLYQCPSFREKNAEQKISLIRTNNLCRKCLIDTHLTKNCGLRLTCGDCGGSHNTLLHKSFYPNGNADKQAKRLGFPARQSNPDNKPTVSAITAVESELPDSSDAAGSIENVQVISAATIIQNNSSAPQLVSRVFLETAIIHILDYRGIPQQCRALLDSGAQANLITQSLANRLKIPRTRSEMSVSGIGEGGLRPKFKITCNIQNIQSTNHFELECQIVPSILKQNMPNWAMDTTAFTLPSDKMLADPTWDVSQPVDILISNEFYNDIIQGATLSLGPGLPYLKESVFGWLISGPCKVAPPSSTAHIAVTLSSIDKTLKQFFGSEQLPSRPAETPEEQAAEAIFTSTTVRDPSTGRYVVHNLFKPNLVRLHNNLSSAIRQFMKLEVKMENDPEFKRLYHETMREYFEKEFFEKVPNEDLRNHSYYMPHHPVLKKGDGPPKLRIVMNASSKSMTGLSLNDCVMVGPIVQPDIVTNLLRLRQFEVFWTCDIKQMYPQVWLHRPHRDFNRIIWRFDPNEPLQHYRAKGACFGVASSSFLATRVTIHLAHCGDTSHPEAARILKNHAYVDDCLVSFPSVEDAKEAARQLIELLGSAGMQLAKWKTNRPDCLRGVVEENAEVLTTKAFALGVEWHPSTDTFHFSIPKEFSTAHTKREALSSLGSLYDPLGLIGPVIVHGKLIMQTIWESKLGWDADLPEPISSQWKKFYMTLPDLQKISVPRWISNSLRGRAREIHIFCDSSMYAYGAVAYVVSSDGESTTSQILIAKSRIAPTERLTIPRLELNAALLGAQLLQKVQEAIPALDYYMWTDSTIVLGQVRSTKSKLDQFVLHRVCEIQALTAIQKWRHVPTNLNPADIISRGAYPGELASSELWWKGPGFIAEDVSRWPVDPSIYEPAIVPIVTVASSVESHDSKNDHPLAAIMNKSVNYRKMKRVLAYTLRVFSKSKPASINILSHELDRADRLFVAFAQREHLAEVRRALMGGGLDTRRIHDTIRGLSPFLDQDGIIRVGGRLRNAPEPFEFKHPMLLPKSALARLIAGQYHLDNLHAGPQQLLSAMRQRYWPLGARSLTRGVTRNCLRCCRHRPTMMNQLMGDLPQDRVRLSAPFTVCGMDFCGPVLTRPAYRRGGVSYKTYVCIFVCFATRAVHIEVVGDLTMQAFIGALRRFVARRSAPSDLYCDNATNFTGADGALRQLFEDLSTQPELGNECSVKGIRFHFIPPRSPHHGGLHEAAVKALKHHLAREIGTTVLTFEELSTVTAQIEAILNSRPLTPLSDCADEPAALTPGHFLVGKPLNMLPAHDFADVPANRLTRWQLCQKLIQNFSSRWKREYLHSLQNRQKWTSTSPNLEVGDFVLLSDDNLPTYRWPMAIVEEVHPGKDGNCRVATVRTAKGSYTRAVQRLARLPIERLSRSQCGPGEYECANEEIERAPLDCPERCQNRDILTT